MPRKGALSVWEMIVLHLLRFGRFREEFEVPEGTSQQGIADGVGITRAHAAVELKTLKERGLVVERLAHVRGAKTKKKAYFLTHEGEREASKMKQGASSTSATIVCPDGREMGMPGGEALVYLVGVGGMSEARAVSLLLSVERIDLREMMAEKPRSKLVAGREMDALRRWLGPNARFLIRQGRLDEAERLINDLMQDARGERRAELERLLGAVFSKRGERKKAEEAFKRVLAMCSRTRAAAEAANELAVLEIKNENYEEAERWLLYGIESKPPPEMGVLLMANLGLVSAKKGCTDAAQAIFRSALEEAERLSLPRHEAAIGANLVDLLVKGGAYMDAIPLAEECVSQLRTLDDRHFLGMALVNLGTAKAHAGLAGEAVDALDEGLALSAELCDPMTLIERYREAAEAYLMAGEAGKAGDARKRAEALSHDRRSKAGKG
ncbi:MAG: tetratricopeptide repeat protein [Candidatus Thermoplasmatota archaeon]